MEVLFPTKDWFLYADEILKTLKDPKTAIPFVDLMKAENIEKVVYSVHTHWDGFYDIDQISLNDRIQINDPNIENRVYNLIIKNY